MPTTRNSPDLELECRSSATLPPAPPARIAVGVGCALLAGVLLAAVIARSGHEVHSGTLQAKGRTVAALRDARLKEVLAAQGSAVRPGTPLLVLSDVELEAAVAHKTREIAALEAEVGKARAQAAIEIAARRQRLEADIFETRLKSAQLLRERSTQRLDPISTVPASTVPAAVRETAGPGRVQRLSHAERLHQPTQLEREVAAEIWELSDVQLDLCRNRLTQLEQRLTDLPEHILEAMGVNVMQARLDQSQSELLALETQQQSLLVASQTHGTVGVYLKEAGAHVAANEAIVELLDEDQPYVLVQVPTSQLADFAPGTILQLTFPGGVAGTGRIEGLPPQVARLPQPHQHVDTSEARVSVVVAPAGKVWPKLPFGSVVAVTSTR